MGNEQGHIFNMLREIAKKLAGMVPKFQATKRINSRAIQIF